MIKNSCHSELSENKWRKPPCGISTFIPLFLPSDFVKIIGNRQAEQVLAPHKSASRF
jgi:hypothetical protein